MKTSKRFNNALSALIKGFFNETLKKGTCYACAVGNIIAYCNNISVKEFEIDINKKDWYNTIMYGTTNGHKQISSTGYSIKEIKDIEHAFESNTEINSVIYQGYSKEQIVQDQFNGLMAVVEVLCKIEQINSKEYKEKFKYTLNNNILESIKI